MTRSRSASSRSCWRSASSKSCYCSARTPTLLPRVLDEPLALGGQVQFAAPALEPLELVPPLTALPVEVPEEPAALGELDEPLALEGELPPVAAPPPVEPIELPVLDGALCALGELL